MSQIFHISNPPEALDFTGERLTSSVSGSQVEVEHLHRYLIALEYCRGKDVLDIASGEGYGAKLLSQVARTVVGVELAEHAVVHATKSYADDHLRFLVGDARAIPLADHSIDVVVSFETLEHVFEQEQFLFEVRRVLRPAGFFIVSTPNQEIYSPSESTANPYHVRELGKEDFIDLVKSKFSNVVCYQQRPMMGSALIPDTRDAVPGVITFERRGPSAIEMNRGLPRAAYLIAVASTSFVPDLVASLYIQTTQFGLMLGELAELRKREQGLMHEVSDLRQEIDNVNARAVNAEDQWRRTADEIERIKSIKTSEKEQPGSGAGPSHSISETRMVTPESRDQDESLAIEATYQTNSTRAENEPSQASVKIVDREITSIVDPVKQWRLLFAEVERLKGVEARALDARARATHTEEQWRLAVETCSKLQQVITSMDLELSKVRQRLADSNEQLAHSNEWLTAIRNSTSWKSLSVAQGLGRRLPILARVIRLGSRGAWRLVRPMVISKQTQPGSQPLAITVAEALPASLDFAIPVMATPIESELQLKERLQEPMRQALRAFLRGNQRLAVDLIPKPKISVLLVLYNQAHLTLRCLQALLRSSIPIELIIVDNCSTDDTRALLSRVDNAKVFYNSYNEGFLHATNRAAEMACGCNLLFLNSDAFVREDALEQALATLESKKEIGVVGGRIVLATGKLQEAGSIIFNDGSALGYGRGLEEDDGRAMFRRQVHFCSGAFLLTPRRLFNELGGLDPRFAPAYYEEADYCERVRANGKLIVYEPKAVIDHFEFGSQEKSGDAAALQVRNRKTFRDRHHEVLSTTRFPHLEPNVLYCRDARLGQRRLLFIDQLVPQQALGSGFPRARAMINSIAGAGWFVTMYPMAEGVVDWKSVYKEIPPEVEICDRQFASGLSAFLQERYGYYDAILVSRPENMELIQAILRENPSLIAGTRLIYDAEALYSLREVRRVRLAGGIIDQFTENKLMEDELKLCLNADEIITVSPLEQSVFSAKQGVPVHLISHPVPAIFTSPPDFESRSGFLFVGRLLEKETPNYDGLSWFIKNVWPRIRKQLTRAELVVVGAVTSEHSELEAPGVSLLGAVADLGPFYDAARVFIAPTRYAAGVPIKVLEAIGAGLVVISTSLIADQLGWTNGREITTADSDEAFADAAVLLHEHQQGWQAQREAAAQRVSIEHSSEVFQKSIDRLLRIRGQTEPHQYGGSSDYNSETPVVSVIVLNLNKSQMTMQCLRHLHLYTKGWKFEIIVVDNGSRPAEVAILEDATIPFRLIGLRRNRYFGEANNIAVESARGEFVCFLNNDAFVQPNWLQPLMDTMLSNCKIGGVGPKFLYLDGRLQEAGALIARDGQVHQLGKGDSASDIRFNDALPVDYISAAAFVMRKDLFLRVLGFDLCWEPAYYEDVDLCLKIASLGLDVYYVPGSAVVHLENATSQDPTANLRLENIIEINKSKLLARWGSRLIDGVSSSSSSLFDGAYPEPMSEGLYKNSGYQHHVALYTPYDLTPGGGERHLLSIAVALASFTRVTLITPDRFSRIRVLTLGRELGLDLAALELAVYEDVVGNPFDLAFILGNELLPAISGLGKRNIYLCQFPFPMLHSEVGERLGHWSQYEQVWVYSPFVERYVNEQMDRWELSYKPVKILAPPVMMQPSYNVKSAKVLNVGRFFTGFHCKRQDSMILAFRQLIDGGLKNVELHLAGSLHPEPENRAYLDSLLKAAKDLPVFFHVNCSIEELASLYRDCRVYWHATGFGNDIEMAPEKAEHFGIAIVEAMSAGCVPVVYASGGPKDLIQHGVTGYLFHTLDELCALTRPILNDPNQEDVRRIAASARESAQIYSDSRFGDEIRARVGEILS
jgi:GT2 family glycosyltransferase/glycosyltransferase involved in cell wall biosynthesis/SAM-dependent methyltransferase